MDSMTNNGREFEGIVLEILEWFFSNSVTRLEKETRYTPDFLIERFGIVGEIKFFSSMRVPRGTVEISVFRMTNVGREVGLPTGVIITTEIDGYGRIKLNEHLSIVRWGLPELLYLCRGNQTVKQKLIRFLKRALPFSSVDSLKPRRPNLGHSSFRWELDPNRRSEKPEAIPVDFDSSDFCQSYRQLGHEKNDARQFETLCVQALQYCLGEHFGKWHPQSRTENGLSVMDLVGRISSVHDFWRMIRDEFRSPYVVFEFKWYKEPVGQTQVFTTEKYLFRTALRSVSFLISGSGLTDNANAAARGALREHGKLIVPVTADQLCEMVTLKENGEDPVTVLSDIVDEILMRLER